MTDKMIPPSEIEPTIIDPSAPTAELRNCSFCGEFKNIRVTPDGDATNPIGICHDCAMKAVVTFHNHVVQTMASLIKSNEAMRRQMQSMTHRIN